MNYWLIKSEPEEYSIDDLERDGTTDWTGVRNFQARNFIRQMRSGDNVLFYASSADPPGVTGVAEVSGEPRPEPKEPTWSMVQIRFVKKFPHIVPLETLKNTKSLKDMKVVQRGQRLSVQPVTKAEFETVLKLAGKR